MKPILFEIGPVPIRAYGAMMMIGFLAGLYWAVRSAKAKKIDTAAVIDASLYSLLAGVIGARLVFILLNWADFRNSAGDALKLWEGGLSFHGGLLFAIAAVYVYTRMRRIPFLVMADLLAPSLALAYAFTRIGCFLNGCCYGVPTDLPWGVVFPDIHGHVHATQLYSSAASFLIFAALTQVQKWEMPQGYVFTAYVAMYSVYRFAIEFLRKGVTAEVFLWGLTEAQVASIVILLLAGVLLYRYRGLAARTR